MRRLPVLFLLLVFVAMPVSHASSSTQDSQSNSTVIAVYDATASSECQIEVQFEDGPWTPIVCPAGTLIQAQEMSLDEALARGSTYLIPSGDLDLDHQLAEELMAELHFAVAPPPTLEDHGGSAFSVGSLAFTSSLSLLSSHCLFTRGRINVNGSYLVGPDGGTKYRAYWAFGYFREASCSVSSIRDRAKVGPSGYGQIRWQGSCAGDTCSRRDIVLVDNWTPVYSVASYASEGSQYTNLGRLASCSGFFCTDYSGYITMD